MLVSHGNICSPSVCYADLKISGETAFGQLRDDGYVCIRNHPLDWSALSAVLSAGAEFFEKSSMDKMAFNNGGKYVHGYYPFGGEYHSSDQPDHKEFWMNTAITDGKVRPWPEDVVGFRISAAKIYRELNSVADLVFRAIAPCAHLPGQFVNRLLEGHQSAIRIIHYPPAHGRQGLRCGSHKDMALLTVIPPAPREGLEIFGREGWHAPAQGDGEIVVFAGEMFERVSNGRVRASAHRVQASPSLEDQHSVVFFQIPNGSVALTPCIEPGEASAYDEVTVKEALNQDMRSIGMIK